MRWSTGFGESSFLIQKIDLQGEILEDKLDQHQIVKFAVAIAHVAPFPASTKG